MASGKLRPSTIKSLSRYVDAGKQDFLMANDASCPQHEEFRSAAFFVYDLSECAGDRIMDCRYGKTVDEASESLVASIAALDQESRALAAEFSAGTKTQGEVREQMIRADDLYKKTFDPISKESLALLYRFRGATSGIILGENVALPDDSLHRFAAVFASQLHDTTEGPVMTFRSGATMDSAVFRLAESLL